MSILTIKTARTFRPLLERARYKGAHGGRGSGKSHFFAEMLVEDCLREPGESGEGLRAVCIREVQKDLKESAKLLIEDKLYRYGLGEADGFRVYRDVISTPGDGLIIFKGMQDYTAESVKSLEKFKRAWIEEAQTLSLRSLTLLRPTIREEGSEIWASWNPYNIPLGGALPFFGTTAPNSSFVLPYGQAISRTSYASLFSLFSTRYGSGDGSTTFNVPNLRGRVVAGLDNMGGVAASRLTTIGSGTTLGAAGGEETHVLTTAEMPSHTHNNTLTDPGHIHSITTRFDPSGAGGGFAVNNFSGSGTSVNTNSATTGITINNVSVGGGGAHNNLPPVIISNYILRII